jgi:hypothetical protein
MRDVIWEINKQMRGNRDKKNKKLCRREEEKTIPGQMKAINLNNLCKTPRNCGPRKCGTVREKGK